MKKIVSKHLVPSAATTAGHQNQERKHLQSTKTKSSKIKPPAKSSKSLKTESDIIHDEDFFPTSDEPNIKTQQVLYSLTSFNEDQVHSDLTGWFPIQSSRGNNYQSVACHHDANGILVQPIKNRQAETLVDAWTIIDNRLKKQD